MKGLKVTCYSGHTYAQEPRSFVWGGVTCEVQAVEKSWRELERICFLVRVGGNKFMQLCYNEAKDVWTLTEVARR